MRAIECVPNVSEGRDPHIVAALADAVTLVPGIRFLHQTSDADHNRSVFTFTGNAPALTQAACALVGTALDRIDLRQQTGVHPRLGAVDVVPFVPLGDATMSECVTLARRTGAEVASRFALPVYLYEEAASAPHRRRLEDLRRGQFEGLAERMRTSDWAPDFGPTAPHPTAGAVVIGARRPLVAYNINLATASLEVARRIARAIRERDGGLPYVKAIGVMLAGRNMVQVSMNLTNIDVTPIPVAFDAVRREATRAGVSIVESELIGLMPATALGNRRPEEVLLPTHTLNQVLETMLASHAGSAADA